MMHKLVDAQLFTTRPQQIEFSRLDIKSTALEIESKYNWFKKSMLLVGMIHNYQHYLDFVDVVCHLLHYAYFVNVLVFVKPRLHGLS